MNWIKADSIEKINEIKALSGNEKVLILKFSPKCAINYVVRSLLEREWNDGEMQMKTYLVDVIANRELSDKIENEFGVTHETPQAIILEKSKPVFSASHGKVIFSELRKYAN
jgi:bacillithiol system protein YtxJ